MKKLIIEKAKKFIFEYTNIGKPNYNYNLDPIQLAEIINSLETLKSIDANICEIGVARGMTSRFICEHLSTYKFNDFFYCIDTFDSFTSEDIEFEIEKRNKDKKDIAGFSYNNFNVWKKNFKQYEFLHPLQTDIKLFDFEKIAPLKFCLLDVDLYIPTKFVLENIGNSMVKGGIVMVDDVMDKHIWDGSYEAFMEFVSKNDLKYKLIGNKCGLIEF